ncbi:MAG: hypothetical protein WBH86_02885 [Thermogutta sp.]|nr:hypothetical protein [Thermogutta sp.]HPU06181.1 hypothetical protein [Thermogutta sp.]HPZ82898.1 hypothetical protein [Thermogutta sp.]HQF15298.1 hypothetical protein [Thermogutta sp.]
MPDCSPAQLIGYLLNALDEEEREEIEQELVRCPELRKKLQRLKRRLAVLELGRREIAPPPGLADRTCQFVFQSCGCLAIRHTTKATSPALPASRDVAGFRLSPLSDYLGGHGANWSFADLVVSALVVLIVVSLLFPALAEVRFRSRVLACRENYRELYQAVHQYQNVNALAGAAGIAQANFAVAKQFLTPPLSWSAIRRCPGMVVESSVNDGSRSVKVSESWVESETAFDREFGGVLLGYSPVIHTASLGSAIPYEQVSLAAIPLWRDSPHPRDCQGWSWNHEGRGENWLFADGHVAFLPRHRTNERPTVLQAVISSVSFTNSP